MKKNFVLLFFSLTFFLVAETLPQGYRDIKLGMSIDEVKKALRKNTEFGYRGDRDVSLLPGENRVLIETEGNTLYRQSFLGRCSFQFYNEKLYIIIIGVNEAKMDHYSIFDTLTKKYGKPHSLSPEKSVWKNDAVTMSLERPLAIKYVDNKTFDDLKKASLVPLSTTEMTRQMFLDEL